MKYQVLQEIYSSPRVRVEKVRAQYDNQTYIQKTFLQNKNEALNAIKVLNQTTNQFILNVIEYFENDEEQLVMIQEYCHQGDLKTFTMQHIGFKMQESIIWSILLQLAYGILELNEMGYQHRCLIPEIIFLLGRTDGYQIRITDFTKASKQTLCQAPCPPVYLPYEYYFSGQYTQKSHIWQFAHILYFMMTKKLLFPQLPWNHKSKSNQEEERCKQRYHQPSIQKDSSSLFNHVQQQENHQDQIYYKQQDCPNSRKPQKNPTTCFNQIREDIYKNGLIVQRPAQRNLFYIHKMNSIQDLRLSQEIVKE